MTWGQDTVREGMCLHAKFVSPQMQYKCWQAGWSWEVDNGSAEMDNGLGWTSGSCLKYKVSSAGLWTLPVEKMISWTAFPGGPEGCRWVRRTESTLHHDGRGQLHQTQDDGGALRHWQRFL